MINRCIYCGDICPDFSDMCDTCAELEVELQVEINNMDYYSYIWNLFSENE